MPTTKGNEHAHLLVNRMFRNVCGARDWLDGIPPIESQIWLRCGAKTRPAFLFTLHALWMRQSRYQSVALRLQIPRIQERVPQVLWDVERKTDNKGRFHPEMKKQKMVFIRQSRTLYL